MTLRAFHPVTKYKRVELYALRRCTKVANQELLERLKIVGILYYRGTRAGRHKKIRHARAACSARPVGLDLCGGRDVRGAEAATSIQVIVRGPRENTSAWRPARSPRVLIYPMVINNTDQPQNEGGDCVHPDVPSIYLINSTSLAKPHAIEHLRADIIAYKPDVAIVVESWLNDKHSDSSMAVEGYGIFRRDRLNRRGGGVAVYCRNQLLASIFQPTINYARELEVLWLIVKMRERLYYVGAVYHPPRPIYSTDLLVTSIDSTLEEIYAKPEDSTIIIAGDFNQLPSSSFLDMGLSVEFDGPSHEGHSLDRIYASVQHLFQSCIGVRSTIKTKHSAVLAVPRSSEIPGSQADRRRVMLYRPRTPNQYASLERHLSEQSWSFIAESPTPEAAFEAFYDYINAVTDLYFPNKSITIKEKDPPFMTPIVKHLIRRRNKLLKKNKMEAASSLSERINRIIIKGNTTTFDRIKRGSREMWKEVSRLRGGCRRESPHPDCKVTAESLNRHFCNISTDANYSAPSLKSTVVDETTEYVDVFTTYRLLTSVGNTATGPDGLAAWLLRGVAHMLAQPITKLFNISILFSYVPPQWKSSIITPVPKVSHPVEAADFRPISVTSILCRLLEKIIAHCFFHPFLTEPQTNQQFSDQYAFRPTGSTTAALIALTHNLTELLKDNQYIHVIALDISKAFDTIRHAYLAEQLAELPIPDCVYNWVVSFLCNRTHVTKYNGSVSTIAHINASIVQGSGLGPLNFITAISKLKTVYPHNQMAKYADDTYLLVPSSRSDTIRAELDHVTEWAARCNLSLNQKKTQEMLIRRPRERGGQDAIPGEVPGIPRVQSMVILGVVMTEHIGFELHIKRICVQARQSMYALRIMTTHGLSGPMLHDVVRMTTVSRLLYASSAWWGFVGQQEHNRLQSVMNRLVRLRYLPEDNPTLEQLCRTADGNLFTAALADPGHVLNPLLPPVKTLPYSLRPRPHDRIVPRADNLMRKTFLTRMLYNV